MLPPKSIALGSGSGSGRHAQDNLAMHVARTVLVRVGVRVNIRHLFIKSAVSCSDAKDYAQWKITNVDLIQFNVCMVPERKILFQH